MTSLSKIFYLFICLFAYLLIFVPSPSLAQGNPYNWLQPCKVSSGCEQYKDKYGDQVCVCLEKDRDENGACTNPTGDLLGSCVIKNCTKNEDCPQAGPGFYCSSAGTCIEQGQEDVLETPYFIRTPQKMQQSYKSPESINSDIAATIFFTQTESLLSMALGGSSENSSGANAGATGILTGLVLNMTTKPVISSKEYLADLGRNLGITPVSPAYAQAQGLGFNAFSPVLKIWKIFRDIAYLIIVAIFIVVGLMVMFRQKIDPRTVVTVQEALPKIIVALIMVTFSYAIAGLVVDLGQFTTRLIAYTLYNGSLLGLQGDTEVNREAVLNANLFELINPIRNVDNIIANIKNITTGPLEGAPVTLAEITLGFAFRLMGFFVMFKIFFALLSPYVSVLLSVIFAPIQLVLAAIPGKTNPIEGWLKGLIVNVAAFPVTFAMLAIAAFLKSSPKMSLCPPPPSAFMGPSAPWCTSSDPITSIWSPTGIGNWGQAAGELAGWAILFTIPKVVELIQQAFEIKPSGGGQYAAQELQKGLAGAPIVGGLFKNITS